MGPELEKELWARIKKQPALQGETPRQVIADFIAPSSRARTRSRSKRI